MPEITETELAPGEQCPVCGKDIVTWRAEQVADVDNVDQCYIETELVEPTGLNTGFAGNIIVIDHKGPTLQE